MTTTYLSHVATSKVFPFVNFPRPYIISKLNTVYIYLPYFLGLNTIRRHKKMLEPHPYTIAILYCCCWAFVKKTITYAHFIVYPHLSLTTVCFFFVCKYYIVQYILQERKKFFGELWQLLDILSCVLRWVIKIGGILRVRGGLRVSWALRNTFYTYVVFSLLLLQVKVCVSNTTS